MNLSGEKEEQALQVKRVSYVVIDLEAPVHIWTLNFDLLAPVQCGEEVDCNPLCRDNPAGFMHNDERHGR